MRGSRTLLKRRRSFFLRVERLEERATPAMMTPTLIRHAYGFDVVAPVGGTTLDGTGQTIAIVDAFYDSTAASDLAAFDTRYGINPPPSFLQVSSSGGSATGLATNSGWAGETALDIEWAHAIAPGANILLVEAANAGGDLDTAVDYARKQPGVSVVSMSWGGGESSGDTSASSNNHFTTPSGHVGGVSFFAAAGDTGGEVIYPSSSPNVLSVGGTTLTLSNGNYGSESAWSSGGGGASQIFAKPTYQTAYTGTMRATPDVSYDANPSSGFAVINNGSLEQVGGTSDAAPQWAALVAIADQGRVLNGLTTLDGATQLLPAIYAMPASNFNDVTTGSNGNPAMAGFDLATGRGTPKAQLVIASLVAYGAPTTTPPVITSQPADQAVLAGQTATFTAAATGTPTPTVQWQISTNGGVTFTNIAGATATTYVTGPTGFTQNGNEYRAVFTNGASSTATTNAATLTVTGAPTPTAQPANVTVTVGQDVSLTAAATGNPAPTIQWQVTLFPSSPFFQNISGATGNTYSFTPTLADSGLRYRAVFTNSAGTTVSDVATLTVVAPVTVTSVTVGDGTAQRSEVRSITVTFSGAVSFGGGNAAAAFQLQHLTDGNDVALSPVTSTNGSGQTVVTLTFSGDETDSISGQNGGQLSLADGLYALTITGSQVADVNGAALDGDADGVAGGDFVSPPDTQGGGAGELGLYRLFGDTNGDGVVDQVDLGQFRAANNSSVSDPAYIASLDADNSGTIDQVDLGQLRQRNNSSVFDDNMPLIVTQAVPAAPALSPVQTIVPAILPTPTAAPLSVVPASVGSQQIEVQSIVFADFGPVNSSGALIDATVASQPTHTIDNHSITPAPATAIDAQAPTTMLAFFKVESDAQLTNVSSSVTGAIRTADGGNFNGPTQLPPHRSVGDVDGDGNVDQTALGRHRNTESISAGESLYLSFLDTDANGTIDLIDLGPVNENVG
jgi:hypothetical protein